MGDKPDFMLPWSLWGGNLKFKYDQTTIGPGGETNLFTITGKGQILSGLIYPEPGTDRKLDIIRVYSDDTRISFWNISSLNLFNVRSIHQAPIYLTCFNAISHYYCVAISPFITFDESLKITVMDGYLTAIKYYTNLTYSLIE